MNIEAFWMAIKQNSSLAEDKLPPGWNFIFHQTLYGCGACF